MHVFFGVGNELIIGVAWYEIPLNQSEYQLPVVNIKIPIAIIQTETGEIPFIYMSSLENTESRHTTF